MAQAPPLRTAADFRPVPAGVRGSEGDYALAHRAHPHAELEKGDPQQLVVEDGVIMLLGRTVSSRARTVKACSTQVAKIYPAKLNTAIARAVLQTVSEYEALRERVEPLPECLEAFLSYD